MMRDAAHGGRCRLATGEVEMRADDRPVADDHGQQARRLAAGAAFSPASPDNH